MTEEEAWRLLDQAELIVPADVVELALARLADEIGGQLAQSYPLVLAVMGGATVFAGHLLPRLRFPLDYDYLHATRYGDATTGGELAWVVEPRAAVAGRSVLLLDDVLDAGVTLAAIKERLLALGAARVVSAVFADKDIGRAKPVAADFVGLTLPDRYVFGFGMDVKGAWRNLPAIYALKDS